MLYSTQASAIHSNIINEREKHTDTAVARMLSCGMCFWLFGVPPHISPHRLIRYKAGGERNVLADGAEMNYNRHKATLFKKCKHNPVFPDMTCLNNQMCTSIHHFISLQVLDRYAESLI